MVLAAVKYSQFADQFLRVIDVEIIDGAILGNDPDAISQMWPKRSLMRNLS